MTRHARLLRALTGARRGLTRSQMERIVPNHGQVLQYLRHRVGVRVDTVYPNGSQQGARYILPKYYVEGKL